MPRHFYLRDSRNFPIACVATEAHPELLYEHATQLTVQFAVSTYNPNDVKLGLKYDRGEAANKAIGRLKSFKHRMSIIVPFERGKRANGGMGVKVAICQSIANGEWAKAHPGAVSASLAARLWLETVQAMEQKRDPGFWMAPADVPPPDPLPIINKDFVAPPPSQPEHTITPVEPAPTEPLVFGVGEARAALTMPEALGFKPIAEIACEPVPEPEGIVINMSEDDRAAINEAFSAEPFNIRRQFDE